MPTRQWWMLIGCLLAAEVALAQAPPGPGYLGTRSIAGPPPMAAEAPLEMDPAFAATPPGAPEIPQGWLASFWNPVPCVEIRGEALFLQPNFEPSVGLAKQTQIDPSTSQVRDVFVSASGSEQFIAAPRLVLEYHLNEFKSIEAVGWVLDGPNQNLSPQGANDSPYFLSIDAVDPRARGPLANLPPGFPQVADEFLINWEFRSQGAELNWLHHFIIQHGLHTDVAVGIGGRYFGMVENAQLSFRDIANGLEGRMTARVDNEMGGPQVIGRTRWQSPLRWFRAVAEGKIGLMANTTETRMNLFTSPLGYNVGNRYTTTVFSPLFEGNFYFEFFLTRNITVFSGIQLLYADRVNRAGGQFEQDVNRFLYDPDRLGSVFLWGPRVGLVLSF